MTDDLLRAALDRHRDDEVPRLEFSVPLDRLMDPTYCQTLSRDLEDAALGNWEVVKATKNAWKMLPDVPGLYMFVWSPSFSLKVETEKVRTAQFDWILYVGKAGDGLNSSSIKTRYKSEYSKLVDGDPEILWESIPVNDRKARMRRFLSITPLNYWYCPLEDPTRVAELETRLFTLLSPPLNAAGSPRLRPVGKPKPAF